MHRSILIASLFLGGLSHASEATPAPVASTASQAEVLQLDNESVWSLARKQAYSVQSAQANLEASRFRKRSNLSPFLPQVTGSLGWQRNNERPLSGERHTHSGSITLEQNLFSFGRRHYSKRLSEANIQVATANLLGAERNAALQAITALESYRFALASVTVAEARVEQRQGELADAEKLFEVGNVRLLDVRESRINLSRANDGLAAAKADVIAAKADLINALGLNSSSPVQIADALRRPQNMPRLAEQATAAISTNADQQALEQAQRADTIRARSELVSSLPTLNGVLGYTESGRRINHLDDDWYVGVNLIWTLIDGGGRYARRNAFLANARRTGSQIEALQADRVREIAVIQAGSSALAARITLQQTIITDSELNYQDARALYQSGEITLTRVGEAGLALSEARFNLNRYIFEESVLAHRLRALSE